ncbi:hypothetical protein [Nocardioides sp.]|uniref:hypothetical protein n=1 Tax=Nocardioides sp. TaxID=35761 RepID=UPI0039E68274
MENVWYQTNDGLHLYPHTNCPEENTVTMGDIRSAFESIPVPESVIVVQPPGGETLVNFDTNFYTVAEPFTATVTVLEHTVDFRIRPQSFGWHFGDGVDKTTTKPGAAYPKLEVTHRYRTKGEVEARVDTVWEAEYRLDGGGWAMVDGTVTKAGAAQSLRIRSATPILVD